MALTCRAARRTVPGCMIRRRGPRRRPISAFSNASRTRTAGMSDAQIEKRPRPHRTDIVQEEFGNGDSDSTASGQAQRDGELPPPLWQLHWRQWVEPASGQYFENVTPITGKSFARFRAPTRKISTARSTLPMRHARPGATPAHASRQHHDPDCPAHGRQPRSAGARPRPGTTASRSARPWPRIFPWPSITGVILPAASAPRKGQSLRSTTTPWPTTSTSRSALWARSFPGISRS
jgi:hypothetical protein